ncbi:MAG: RNA methyltransferase [bacterium]|nr:RNA methyltransferase [bacterium]
MRRKRPEQNRARDKRKNERGRPRPSAKNDARPTRPVRSDDRGPAAAAKSAGERVLLFGRRPVQAYIGVLPEPSKNTSDSDDSQDTSRSDIENIYLGESLPRPLREGLLRKLPGVPYTELPRRELDQKFPDLHHQGVVLRFRAGARPANRADNLDWREFVQERSGLLLLLDRIQDPQNLGSILRSAEALGVRAVFMTGQGAPLGDTAHRVSSGASLRLPIFHQTNLHRLVEDLKSCEYWICCAADSESAEQKHRDEGEAQGDDKSNARKSRGGPLALKHNQPGDLPPAAEIALIIGNEGEGVKPLVVNQSDYILSIPLRGETESLNAGVAAGILIDRLLHR